MKIDSCLAKNAERGITSEDCSYEDFVAYMDSISLKGDLDTPCSVPFVPPK